MPDPPGEVVQDEEEGVLALVSIRRGTHLQPRGELAQWLSNHGAGNGKGLSP
jgi:hypothetical protein